MLAITNKTDMNLSATVASELNATYQDKCPVDVLLCPTTVLVMS